MNIKLNMLLSQSPHIENFFVLPSCGDESLALGAAYLTQEKLKRGSSQPISHLALGYAIGHQELEETLKRHQDKIEFEHCPDIEKRTAQLLAEDKIVGRVSGRAEWGARALGQRSILCNPSKAQNIQRINKAVKKRDFWMPFCPSILDEDEKTYLINPKNQAAYYMTIGFESKKKAQKDIVCGLHPFDQTARPQIVTENLNPKYHKLIKEFKKQTGIGGVVNTSFNLHGLPIVNDTEDAIHVLLNSEIDYVAIEDYLVWKRKPTREASS